MLHSRTHHLLAIALALPVAAIVATLPACDEQAVKDGGTYSMQISGKPFTLKVASTEPTRMKGLGGVESIAEDGGMIFIFPDSQLRSFHMKDCITDMDIIFLDPLGYVTAVHTMTMQPPKGANETDAAYADRLVKYRSLSPAQFAIELRKGRATELGIKTRQKIALDAPTLRSAAK